jgi:hypothetical protein
MRIAFDRLQYKEKYERALRIAQKHGFREFSNYMLFNEKDTPRDLYDRLQVNINLNLEWGAGASKSSVGVIYSYPMRFAPIKDDSPLKQNRKREYIAPAPAEKYDYLADARWTKRFTRNIEIIKGAAHGAITPKPSLAERAIGRDYDEYIANLYMPEEFLRNRNKHERYVYPEEPPRAPGDGLVEEFRAFILDLLSKQDDVFIEFHNAVSPCSKEAVKQALKILKHEELREWLEWYLK